MDNIIFTYLHDDAMIDFENKSYGSVVEKSIIRIQKKLVLAWAPFSKQILLLFRARERGGGGDPGGWGRSEKEIGKASKKRWK